MRHHCDYVTESELVASEGAIVSIDMFDDIYAVHITRTRAASLFAGVWATGANDGGDHESIVTVIVPS